MERVLEEKAQFGSISFWHFTLEVDLLSKLAIGDISGFVLFSKFLDGSLIDSDSYYVFIYSQACICMDFRFK